MAERGSLAEALILDALRQESTSRELSCVLLIGMQSRSTVSAAGEIVGNDHLVLLHLDRATDAVGVAQGVREAFVGDDLAAPGPFALVGLNVEAARSYTLLRDVVGQAAACVSHDGSMLVAGPRRGGAEVAARALRERFESVELLAYRKGERIYRASRSLPPPTGPTEPAEPEIGMVDLRGRSLRLVQDERIFAKGRLDPATRMLADVFEVRPGAAVLDLGSGSGILGILAGLLEPSSRVVLIDSDPLAVEVSRRNAALNAADNVSAHLSDLLADLPDHRFDLILMNPPFHRGRTQEIALGERFIAEAGRALLPGGTIYVVCNQFLRYEPTLERLVGPVREAAGDRHYKVLTARRK
jgi:16S rRNA (guanine1207-N2)-methyltransferase